MTLVQNGIWLMIGLGIAGLVQMWRESTHRVHNFSAGPGPLPLSVLTQARDELLDYQDTGMSFMELSHRDVDGPVQTAMSEAQNRLRRMLAVPASHTIMFMHGGAHGQFAAAPLNLLRNSDETADYVVTGYWSGRAMEVAGRHAKVRHVEGTKTEGETKSILSPEHWDLSADAKYVHICASETIDGLEFLSDPVLPAGPTGTPRLLVADFTSTLLSRPVDVSKYALIYASGGKNLGPAGFTLVIGRTDLLMREQSGQANTPAILDYQLAASSLPINSIYNTPPTFPIYMHALVLQHLEARWQTEGGGAGGGVLPWLQQRVRSRAKLVYEVIDSSRGFYRNVIAPEVRSVMNVPCRIRAGEMSLEKEFVRQAEALGMFQLFGHPVRGGLRVTLYNGVTDEAVAKVVEFMKTFATVHA